MADPAAVLVDWGTSNFRAWAIVADGAVIERRTAALGIMQVAQGGFPAALADQVGAWRTADPALPVLMSGMVGSRQGWHEAPYADCPAGIADLAQAVVEVPGATGVRIVPGVAYRAPDGRHDVMRGEEVQIFGALELTVGGASDGRQVFCLPGTHSKWATVADRRIDWFATSMTGEAYAVMAEHSILGRLMAAETAHDPAAFSAGLALAAEPGGLLNHLFAVRAEGLFETVPAAGLRAYLSGILIGHEVGAMTAMVGSDGPVTLIGRPDVARLYETAIAAAGRPAVTVDSETATLKGLSRLQASLNTA